MEKKMRKVLFLLGIITGIVIAAQDRPMESISLINNAMTSNDLYNGAVKVEIPLFEIPVGNLTLSNKLSNTSRGFNPRSDESIYGMNWYGNSFGQITRKVNKDFLLTKFFVIDSDAFGIIASQNLKDVETTDCIEQSQGLLSTYTKKKILTDPVNLNIGTDFSPDRFYFDFFGYTGYFVFDNKGKALVYCENGKLQVLPNTYTDSKCYSTIQPINFQNKNITEIKLKDDKGNTFYFGGDFNSVEVTYNQYRNSGQWNSNIGQLSYQTLSRANNIISWNLKKVELANGDIIIANYKTGDPNIFSPFLQQTLINTTSSTGFPTTFPSKAATDQANVEVSYTRELVSVYPNFVDFNVYTKRSIIENIEVIGKDIKINYNYFKDNNNLIHLSGININYSGKSENIILSQTQLGGQYYRYFLESIKKNDEKYYFEYYKTNELPSKNTNGINNFGFWTGTNIQSDTSNQINVLDVGMLKKVTYPSQGFTTYYYEQGDIGKTINSSNTTLQPIVSDLATDTKYYMSRLASKVDNDGEKEYITSYTYKQSNGRSSGIERNYGQVQENTTKGIVEYYFSDYITNPDTNNNRRFNGDNTWMPYSGNRSYQRGKMLKKKIYDSSNNLVRQYEYEYKSFLKPESELVDQVNNDCTICEISDDAYYVNVKTFFNDAQHNRMGTTYMPVIPYLLNKEKVTDYINGKAVSTETNIKYRESNRYWHPYPEQIETTTSAGTGIKKILYAHDLYLNGCTSCAANESIVGGQYPTYAAMTNANIMYPVIEIAKNKDNKYSLQENLFYAPPFVPKKTRSSKLGTTLDFTNYTINTDKTVDNISYDLLDDKANYLQTTDKSGVPTVTIYGYKQTSPIAKIVGITYIQLMQILGQTTTPTAYLNLDIVTKSNADIDASSEQALVNELETFRNNSALKDFPITTYTYDPLIGVTSITPPSGIREIYIYGSDKKLEKILDAQGRIIKEYKYHYAPRQFFNQAINNKSYTKNNCPTGMISSSTTYSVPANKYMSIISQQDADQQAENEGQNYANSNLVCYYPYCDFNAQASSQYIMMQYAPFEKANTVVNAQLHFMVTSNQGVNWSDTVQLGNIPSPCWPTTTIYRTSGNWQVIMYPNSGQTVLKWMGSGSPATGISYNISFSYDVN